MPAEKVQKVVLQRWRWATIASGLQCFQSKKTR